MGLISSTFGGGGVFIFGYSFVLWEGFTFETVYTFETEMISTQLRAPPHQPHGLEARSSRSGGIVTLVGTAHCVTQIVTPHEPAVGGWGPAGRDGHHPGG